MMDPESQGLMGYSVTEAAWMVGPKSQRLMGMDGGSRVSGIYGTCRS